MTLKYLGLAAVITALTAGQLYAQDHKTAIKQMLKLPATQEQGICMRSVLQKDITGKELFATEQCPFIKSATIDITPEVDQPGAGKGKLHIVVTCQMKYNDYYAGKLKKTFDHAVKGTIDADYMYALKDLSLKNVTVQGDRFCAHPIKQRIKKFQ
jgi:hypothetical protein